MRSWVALAKKINLRRSVNEAIRVLSVNLPLVNVASSDALTSPFSREHVRKACSVSSALTDFLSSKSKWRFSRSFVARSESLLNSLNLCKGACDKLID